ncbi:MAG: hypothetical protein C4548_05405 [Desulfobacteraceae bacterium]|nr:MAG: hypothetical protein C4548_05405 [Desulfobacteraceae bacterium]
MRKQMNPLLLIGLIGVFVVGSIFVEKYWQATRSEPNMWWTPMSMALQLDETRSHFELFIRGELLQNHIRDGSLSLVSPDGASTPVTSDDIRVRLNNWPAVHASFLSSAILPAFLFGVSLSCLAAGIILLRKRNAVLDSMQRPVN